MIVGFICASILIAIGSTGNSLVITAVRKKRSLQTPSNFLLANLALADIVTLLSCFGFLVNLFVEISNQKTGDYLCKFIVYVNIPTTTAVVSILTLTVLSIERYNAVVRPLQAKLDGLGEQTVRYVIAGIWITAILFNYVPTALLTSFKHKGMRQFCHQDFSGSIGGRIFPLFFAFFFILIPFVVISVCYYRMIKTILRDKNSISPANVHVGNGIPPNQMRKRRMIRTCLSVTVAFAICFLPLSIILILDSIGMAKGKIEKWGFYLLVFDSIVNPFIYALQSANYRSAFVELLKCRS